jgi:hypothetical protein
METARYTEKITVSETGDETPTKLYAQFGRSFLSFTNSFIQSETTGTAVVTVETASIRFSTTDTPVISTADTTGLLVGAGVMLTITGIDDITDFRAVKATEDAAVLQVEYYV